MTFVSVCVEWDNFKPSRAHRPRAMLQSIDRQAAALGRPAEIIITFNSEEVAKDDVESFVEGAGVRPRPGVDVRYEGRDGIEYHQLKNAGGDVANGEIVAFIDSDVVPEDTWLAAIAEAFEDPDVEVVSGATYTGPLDSLYNRCVASFWRFEPRPDDAPPETGRGFWSNNVAFRRETFAKHHWPVDPRIRDENVDFNRNITAAGVRMVHAPKARLEHSPPISAGHFVRYGLSDGFNRALRRVGRSPALVVLAIPVALAAIVTDMARFGSKIARRWRRVGLRPAELPAAVGLALCMALVTAAGCAITPLTGDLIPNRFQF